MLETDGEELKIKTSVTSYVGASEKLELQTAGRGRHSEDPGLKGVHSTPMDGLQESSNISNLEADAVAVGGKGCVGEAVCPTQNKSGQANYAPCRSGQAKKKHRRRPSRRKRRWKPYYRLSWEERRALEERESTRASRVRAEMLAKGLPVAPYNTTQFIMEEHDPEEPDLNTETVASGLVGVCCAEEAFSREEEEEEEEGHVRMGGEYLQRDFSETYERYHVESLQNMSKQELVQEYLELEKCLSRLEEENARLRLNEGTSDAGARIRELEDQLRVLRTQNQQLCLQRKE